MVAPVDQCSGVAVVHYTAPRNAGLQCTVHVSVLGDFAIRHLAMSRFVKLCCVVYIYEI